ncbi:tetraacyldisaccharide 4'-kinase [Terasakiella sp. SH-1]|uniref:tetraacyldisaccharide 4'-kinase n=1 Tax=Terasakiella sp. SH-1 TaxID=2560057 RepID=UPI001F0E0B5D|nr:tetraacyldisaccharide 4'-kinase [Terasakiella sp. SH-1]
MTTRRANQEARGQASAPVICIGNLTMGGAGKTPTAMAIAALLKQQGKTPFFLSRGYGGSLSGPVIVDDHGAEQVGDEPLLLKQIAPVCVSHDRVAGADLCVRQGADVIIMDDGFQNPHLYKDMSLLVVDGGYGHGNEKVFPAGPLREKLASGLKRAHGVIMIGTDQTNSCERIQAVSSNIPLMKADIQVEDRADLAGQKVVAFAGIGRPGKFFDTVQRLGCIICETVSFADHHPYSLKELIALQEQGERYGAKLLTTQKDWVRLPEEMRKHVDYVKISLVWQDQDVVKALLASL